MGFLAVFAVYAQPKQNTISGTVKQAGKPVDKATVTLFTQDSLALWSVVTTADGVYELSPEKNGKYFLSASAVGFATAWSDLFAAGLSAGEISLPDFDLKPATKELNNVTVVYRKPVFEQKIDRMVVNVDASPANVGITALEVLERTPGVTLDKDGNISLKGKNGVLILMDGKPTYLSNADVVNLLRSLPSSQLEQLEIMTNPPAKFDAAGNAGVINIKTKKSKSRGFNGSLTLGGGSGNKARSNNSLNLNYRHNKVNVFSNYSYNYNGNMQELYLKRKFFDANNGQVVSLFDQETFMDKANQTHTVKLGMDYFANKKTTYGIVLTGLYNPSDFESDNVTNIKNQAGVIQTRMESFSKLENLWKNGGVNLNFRHQFDSTGRELSAEADFLGYKSSSDQLLSSYFFNKDGQPSSPDEIVDGSLPSNINIYSFKVDYVHPLKNKMKLEAGVKSSLVNTDNDAQYQFWENGQWEKDIDRSNRFKYKENINALYINTSKEINEKWSAQLGLRLENTLATGDQVTTNETFERNYTQLFPTAFVNYKANEKNQFTMNYGRRIQRPDYKDMNPFYFFLDKYTYQVGNPYLRPQFSHNIELSHTLKGFLTTTLNYTTTKDIINQLIEQDDATNTTFVKAGNLASQQQIGLSVSAGFPITKWWTTNIYMNGFYNEFEGPINGTQVKLTAPAFMSNLQNIFKFDKGWGGEISGFFMSRTQDGIFTARSMGQMNMAVSKDILKGKGSLRMNIRDPFDWQYFRGSTKYGNVDVDVRNYWDNRTVFVSFSYRFGKPVKGPQNRRKSGAGDEQNRVKTD